MTKIVNIIEKYEKNYFEAIITNPNDADYDFKIKQDNTQKNIQY